MSVSISVTLPRSAAHVGVARDLVAAGLRRMGAPDELVDEMRVVVSEAASNVVRHAAGAAEYTITMQLDDGSCSVTVSSDGPTFDAPDHPQLPPATAENGRGMALMSSLTDAMDVQHHSATTTLALFREW